MEYERELEVAVQAVRLAAKVCRSVQSGITNEVLEKEDRSPVTVADYSSQAVVCRAIANAFPDDPIIGEEDSSALLQSQNAPFLELIVTELSKQKIDATYDQICSWIDQGGSSQYTDRFWTLDPIDGTKGFLRGDQYAISLALLVDGRIDVGILACPNLINPSPKNESTGGLFYAVRGQGSFAVPLVGVADPTPVRVSSTCDWSRVRFCESVESSHSAHGISAQVADRLGIVTPPVRLDSQAKYAVVARGEADIYLRLPTRADYNEKIWDHAGGVLVVEEAGGRVSDIYGNALQFTHGRELSANCGVVVSNGTMHERVLATLREIGVA